MHMCPCILYDVWCILYRILPNHMGKKNLYMTFDESFIGIEHFKLEVITNFERFKVNILKLVNLFFVKALSFLENV